MADNPARRLHTILVSLKEDPNATERQAWEHALWKPDSNGLLLQRLAETSALVDEIERVLQAHPERDHYMRWAPAVQGLFTHLSFPGTGRVREVLTDLALEQLENCAVRISEMDLGPEFDKEGIDKLVAQLEDVIKEATTDEKLAEDVKDFVVHQCTAIREALQAYPITGNRGLRAASEASVGRWFTSPEIVARMPAGIMEGFHNVIMRILTNVVTQTGTKQLQGVLDSLLPGG